jgi:hypothetical protein
MIFSKIRYLHPRSRTFLTCALHKTRIILPYLEPYVLWSELKNQYKKNEGDKWTQQDYEVIKDKKIKVVLYQYT